MASPSLNVAIVGGGIAGLVAALALHETGHDVTVYEKQPGVQTIGGPIAIMPNGVRALKKMGLSDVLGSVINRSTVPWRWRKWETGALLSEMSGDRFSNAFGESNQSFARADLHKNLWLLVEQKGILVEAQSRVTSVVESEPAIVFENGRRLKVDLVVGADGIHSIVRESFLQREDVDIQSPGSYYMLDCPRSKVAEHPDVDVSRFMEEATFWMGPERSATCSHLIRDGDRYHMAIYVPHALSPVGVWGRHGRTSDIKKYLDGAHSSFDKLLGLIEDKDCYVWRLAQINPLKTWLSPSQKVVVIGDAAHAMVPNAAQGATMGIEDAVTLAVILSRGISSKADIPAALRTFETLRKPRCEFVVARAAHREKLYHLIDGPEQEARDARMKKWGQMYTVDKSVWDGKHIDTPPPMTSPLSDVYLMGYDAVDHTRRTLEQWGQSPRSSL